MTRAREMHMDFIERSRFGFTLPAAALCAVAFAAAAGCGEETQTQTTETQAAKPATSQQAATEAAQVQTEDVYVYTSIGKRDPFVSFFSGYEENPEGKLTPPTPLEKYDISQFRLVGVVTGISNPKAMVEGPDGQGYIIKRGTLIGKHRGRVSQIKKEEVIISEEYRDATGKRVTNQIPLKLQVETVLEKVE